MSKKDRNEADPLVHLAKKERERLEKLSEEWDKKADGSTLLANFTAPDLRLLLEHSLPLHALIRQIAATAPGQTLLTAAAQVESERDGRAEENQALRQQLAACQEAQAALRQQLDAKEKQQAKLAAENRRLAGALDTKQREASQLQSQLRQQAVLPPALDLPRSDPALAERLGLSDLSADASQALIRSVAVLAQIGTIERLWDALKERCEREGRAVSGEETALLQTALDWHNHNWQKKPYRLHVPGKGAGYDFATQQRATATPAGEALSAVWLPGIVAGNGVVQKKALVATR